MPVSPDYAAGLAKDVLAIYAQAEETLLEKIASRLARGITEPGWADAKLLEIQGLRIEVEQVIADLAAGSDDAIEHALRIGYNRGVAAAGADLAGVGTELGISFGRVNEHAVTALVKATQARVELTHLRIRRWTTDVYTDVVHQSAGQVITGVETRQQAARRALAEYAKRGVTGFVDKAGRGWDLATYAEMSTRTAAAQATVQGHVDKLQENGLDLVMVSNAPEECSRCRPWEGKVLSLSGSGLGRHSGDNLHGSGTVTITVEHTLAQATDAGLFHPNCRHSTALYQVGVTVPLVDTADPEGDQLRQRQRTLERSVRSAKKAELVEKAWENSFAKDNPKGTPNPFTDARRKASAHAKDARGTLKEFVIGNDRKDLAYRTSLKAR